MWRAVRVVVKPGTTGTGPEVIKSAVCLRGAGVVSGHGYKPVPTPTSRCQHLVSSG
jgi:hypothetical protein